MTPSAYGYTDTYNAMYDDYGYMTPPPPDLTTNP